MSFHDAPFSGSIWLSHLNIVFRFLLSHVHLVILLQAKRYLVGHMIIDRGIVEVPDDKVAK